MQMKSDRERALHTDVCIDFAIMRMDFTYASTIHCGDASMRPMKSVIILTGVPFCVRLEFNFSFKSSKVWQVWNGFREAINICIFYKPFFLRAQRSVTYHTHFNNSLSHNLNRPNNKIMSSCIYLNSRFLEHLRVTWSKYKTPILQRRMRDCTPMRSQSSISMHFPPGSTHSAGLARWRINIQRWYNPDLFNRFCVSVTAVCTRGRSGTQCHNVCGSDERGNLH